MKSSTKIKHHGDCACMTVRKASRTITRLYDSALAPSGLKATQFSMLQNIKTHGPINVSALAKKLTLDRTTLVRNLKPLETKVFIKSISSQDPRERQICITDQGLQALGVAMPRWKEVQSTLAERIGVDQLNMLEDFVSGMEGLLADKGE